MQTDTHFLKIAANLKKKNFSYRIDSTSTWWHFQWLKVSLNRSAKGMKTATESVMFNLKCVVWLNQSLRFSFVFFLRFLTFWPQIPLRGNAAWDFQAGWDSHDLGTVFSWGCSPDLNLVSDTPQPPPSTSPSDYNDSTAQTDGRRQVRLFYSRFTPHCRKN